MANGLKSKPKPEIKYTGKPGRPVGSQNRNTVGLWRELERMGMGTTFDDPVVWMARVYSGQIKVQAMGPLGPLTNEDGTPLMVEASMSVKSFCSDKVASYIYPKLKSIELKRAAETPSTFDTTKLPAGTLEQLHQVATLAAPPKGNDEPVSN